MKYLAASALVSLVVSSHASVQFYNSTSFSGNAAVRSAWLTDLGIAGGDFLVDFEGYTTGTGLDGVDLGGGASITHPTGFAFVVSAASAIGGSNPIGTKALGLDENPGSISLDFVTPVLYVGGFDIDMPGGILQVTLTDNATFSLALDSTGPSGNTAEFWGVRSLTPALGIKKVEFLETDGGDFEWALDNLEYGVEPVPEPATMAALALGLGVIAKRRKRA